MASRQRPYRIGAPQRDPAEVQRELLHQGTNLRGLTP